jgi:7-carboxy-7-deazaguanine synthase
MSSGRVHVVEVFTSIQGESSYAGWPCLFIRLGGCNLACVYCDTPGARLGGAPMSIDELAERAQRSGAAIVEVTGGEPLLQAGFPALAEALCEAFPGPVLVETNGSQDLSRVPPRMTAIVDVKTPGSGAGGSFDRRNLGRLRAHDEVKFVLCSRADYDWARAFVATEALGARCGEILFSPAADLLAPRELAAWMLADGLKVRLQIQLHKVLGAP